MPRKPLDITGNVYEYLTAIRDTGKRTYGSVWLFECRCGVTKELVKSEVTGGKVKSCGCRPNSGQFVTTHGDTESPTYITWRSMLDRCTRESASNYHNYGGRGITICAQWYDYETFKSDMGERPDGHTLDRINTNSNYEPSNCRWATHKTQSNNMRTNVYLTFNGETHNLNEWSEITGLSKSVLRNRVKAKWDAEDILTIPRYQHRN